MVVAAVDMGNLNILLAVVGHMVACNLRAAGMHRGMGSLGVVVDNLQHHTQEPCLLVVRSIQAVA